MWGVSLRRKAQEVGMLLKTLLDEDLETALNCEANLVAVSKVDESNANRGL
jgi:hypothetical protein